MKLHTRGVRLFLSALVALLTLSGATARAASISFFLNGGNPAISGYPGPYAKVTVDLLTSTTATVTFDALANATNQFLLGAQGAAAVNASGDFNLDSVTSSNSFAGFTSGPVSDGGSGNEDGFGSFNQTIDSFDGYTHSSTQIVLNLSLNTGTWASASDVLFSDADSLGAAAHIFVCAGLSCDPAVGALATGYAAGNSSCPDCVPVPDVEAPEPGSLLLLGTGLVAVARRFRRA